MRNSIERIRSGIEASIQMKTRLLENEPLLERLAELSVRCVDIYQKGGKVLFCGNGGSAADAQHLAAELSGRFYLDRPALFAEALHVNTSFLTAVGNDFGFEATYARMVEAAGRRNDLLIALSTSGNSPNVLRAAEKARQINMVVAGFTGAAGGQLKALSDWWFPVPSADTPRIQEGQLLLGHLLCELIEEQLFGTPG